MLFRCIHWDINGGDNVAGFQKFRHIFPRHASSQTLLPVYNRTVFFHEIRHIYLRHIYIRHNSNKTKKFE